MRQFQSSHHLFPLAYALFNTSASVAKMVQRGLLANIGAHGEPPLGVNYHAEMGFTSAGSLSNYEVRPPFLLSSNLLINYIAT
jgi:hypothetical protein